MVNSQEEWTKLHSCCPKCGSDHIIITLMAHVQIQGQPYRDDINFADCGECNWKGKVNQLVEEKINE